MCRRALPPTPQASHWTYDHIEMSTRLDAATMVEGLLVMGTSSVSLEHDVPEFMIARRKAAQAQAYALPRSHLMHGTEEVWRQLEVWFLE